MITIYIIIHIKEVECSTSKHLQPYSSSETAGLCLNMSESKDFFNYSYSKNKNSNLNYSR